MNLHITTKELNASGKLFFNVRGEYISVLTAAEIRPESTGVVKLGYNAGLYGWNYDVYMIVKKTGVYYIVCGHRNLPKRIVKWSLDDLEEILAAD